MRTANVLLLSQMFVHYKIFSVRPKDLREGYSEHWVLLAYGNGCREKKASKKGGETQAYILTHILKSTAYTKNYMCKTREDCMKVHESEQHLSRYFLRADTIELYTWTLLNEKSISPQINDTENTSGWSLKHK